MKDSARLLRVSSAEQRLAQLRTEMRDVGEPPPLEVPTPDDEPLVAASSTTPFEVVLEDEIRALLHLSYQLLPANQRHYLIKAGVALWAAKNSKGPEWGKWLDEPENAA